jgi:hypothetical protein
MMVQLNLLSQQKWTGILYFQQSTCTWDNDGTADPAPEKSKTVGILLLSTILLVLGTMMEPRTTCSTRKSELLGYISQQFNLYLGQWRNG